MHSKLSNDQLIETILALNVPYTHFRDKNENLVSILASSLFCTVVIIGFLYLFFNALGWIYLTVSFGSVLVISEASSFGF